MQDAESLNITQAQFENLKKLPELIRAIPPGKFDMEFYRAHHDTSSLICNYIGDVIGHTIGNFPDAISYEKDITGLMIDFAKSSENAFGFEVCSDAWLFLFSPDWTIYKEGNTPEQAARRVELLLKIGGTPCNWKSSSIY